MFTLTMYMWFFLKGHVECNGDLAIGLAFFDLIFVRIVFPIGGE